MFVQKCQAILNKGFRVVVDKFSALALSIFFRILTHGYGFQNTRCPAVGNSPPDPLLMQSAIPCSSSGDDSRELCESLFKSILSSCDLIPSWSLNAKDMHAVKQRSKIKLNHSFRDFLDCSEFLGFQSSTKEP